MYVTFDVGFGVVDDLMDMLAIQPVVSRERVAVDIRASLHMLADKSFDCLALNVLDVPDSNPFWCCDPAIPSRLLYRPARARDLGFSVFVHEAGEAADKRFVYLEVAG